MRLRFDLKTARGPGWIDFELENPATGDGEVAEVVIPDSKALREWERQTDGNPEAYLLPGGAVEPDEAKSNIYCVAQVLRSMTKRFNVFVYECPGWQRPADEEDIWH